MISKLKYCVIENCNVSQAISCVSGGAYTGAAFVETLYHLMKYKKMDYNGTVPRIEIIHKEAVKRFFTQEEMSEKAGFLVDCHGGFFKGKTPSC